MTLRPLAPGDAPALTALVEATGAFTEEELGVAAELIGFGHDDGPDGYRFVVAEVGGEPAGFACFGRAPLTDGTWDLYWIAVGPVHQRRGIGGELLAAAESSAASDGARLLLVETASKPSYEGARRFYERHGYDEVARVPDFYALGDDKVVYAKRLLSQA
jgi:ribosomal protein S18 acetylase RimI-like enzyme